VTVVGVAGAGYGGLMPGMSRDLFLSLSSIGPTIGEWATGTLERRSDHWFMVKARLADGVTPAQAQSAMNALAARLGREFPEFNDGRDITVFAAGEVRVHPDADAELQGASTALATVAGLLLLLVCSNLANLLLVRATTRSHEVSLRLALGASRGQIVTHVVSESLLLAAAGGVAGVALAWYLTGLLGSGTIPLPLPATLDLRLDTAVLGFTAALSLLVGVAFGLVPAWRLTRSDAMSVLRGEAAALSSSGRTLWVRNGLVAVQVVASCVILVLATLFARSLANAGDVDLGFRADDVAILRTDVAHAGYAAEEAPAIYARLERRVAALPGVESVAFTAQLPLSGGGSSTLSIPGYQSERGTGFVEVDRSVVSPGYFTTLQVPILHGREFTEADLDGSSGGVAIISRAMARAYWDREDVVGEQFGFQSSPDVSVRVVGVAGDVKVDSVAEAPTPLFYLPGGGTSRFLLARTTGSAETALPEIRAALNAIDGALPTLALTTLDAQVSESLALRRVGTLALGGFGGLGLLLAGLGLYAVVAYSVQQRTREIGIRMVLGASARELVGGVIREMVLIILVAGAIGLVIGRAIAPLFADGLIGVDGFDTTTAALAVGMLILTAVMAGWLPARRATRLDPVVALRSE
jgi:predicted permease